MDPVGSTQNEQTSDDNEVQLRKEKVRFYISDSTNLDELVSDERSSNASNPQAKPTEDEDLHRQAMAANLKRRRYSKSHEETLDLSDSAVNLLEAVGVLRPPSDGTLSSSSSSSIGRRSKGSSTGESYADEVQDTVPGMQPQRKYSIEQKRDALRKGSTGSSGYCTMSRSSYPVDLSSSESLKSLDNVDTFDTETSFIVRHICTLIEEIEPADIKDAVCKDAALDMDKLNKAMSMPARKDRALAFLLCILKSDIKSEDGDSPISVFYNILQNNYTACFQMLKKQEKDEAGRKVDEFKGLCPACIQNISQIICDDLVLITNTDSLLLAFLQEEVLPLSEFKSMYQMRGEEKLEKLQKMIELLMIYNTSKFLRAFRSTQLFKSRNYVNKILEDSQIKTCEGCTHILRSGFKQETDISSEKEEISDGQIGINVMFFDLSKNSGDQLAVIKLDVNNEKEIVEILDRKKSKLNKECKEFGKIQGVYIGSVVVILKITSHEGQEDETQSKVIHIMKKFLEDEEVNGYIGNKELEVTVAVSDTEIDTDGDLISKKIMLTLHMSLLLEELDVIHFKQVFDDRDIMLPEDFQSTFKIEQSTRRERTDTFLQYVLGGDSKVMDAFMEVVNSDVYQTVAQQLKQPAFYPMNDHVRLLRSAGSSARNSTGSRFSTRSSTGSRFSTRSSTGSERFASEHSEQGSSMDECPCCVSNSQSSATSPTDNNESHQTFVNGTCTNSTMTARGPGTTRTSNASVVSNLEEVDNNRSSANDGQIHSDVEQLHIDDTSAETAQITNGNDTLPNMSNTLPNMSSYDNETYPTCGPEAMLVCSACSFKYDNQTTSSDSETHQYSTFGPDAMLFCHKCKSRVDNLRVHNKVTSGAAAAACVDREGNVHTCIDAQRENTDVKVVQGGNGVRVQSGSDTQENKYLRCCATNAAPTNGKHKCMIKILHSEVHLCTGNCKDVKIRVESKKNEGGCTDKQ